jgi:glycosyltransferase involved in cell wall biosynthesis
MQTFLGYVMRTNLRVSIISSLGPPPYLGGIENVIDTVLKSNLRNRYVFQIFDTHRKADIRRKSIEKIFYSITLAAGCFQHLYRKRPDIVHIHFCSKTDFWKHSICLIVAKIMGIKTIYHLHGGSFDAFYGRQRKLVKAVIRKMFSLPDFLIALSLFWRNFLSNIVDFQKIRIVPNPINCTEMAKYVGKQPFGNQKNILLIGSLGRRKGHYDALKAMGLVLERHKDAVMYFAGADEDPDATNCLKEMAVYNKVEKNVRFIGPVSGDDKLKLFGKTSIVILPSYAENMPISVLEGMAASKPVIATRVGALPELMEERENGILIDPGDWKDLARHIIYLLENPDEAIRIGEIAGRTVKRNWDIGRIELIYDELYQACLKS